MYSSFQVRQCNLMNSSRNLKVTLQDKQTEERLADRHRLLSLDRENLLERIYMYI